MCYRRPDGHFLGLFLYLPYFSHNKKIRTAVSFGFLDRSRYFREIAPQLSSRGWVDPVPDPLLLRKFRSSGNRKRNLWICSQEPWPLDHRGGLVMYAMVLKRIFSPDHITTSVRHDPGLDELILNTHALFHQYSLNYYHLSNRDGQGSIPGQSM
jgi:hypothetical protein